MNKYRIMFSSQYGGEAREATDAFRRVEPKVLNSLLNILAKKDFFTRDELEQLIDGDCYIEDKTNER